MAGAEDGFFDSNGVKIRYVAAGEGEPVVLIHGWMADSTMWGRDAFGNTKLDPPPGFRVIALDCRGHGKSDKPHKTERYGVEMAADVVRLLDTLKIKKAHLVGYSMGAFIAGTVAAKHPKRVISVVYGGQAPLLTGEAGSREIDVFAKAVDEGTGLGPYLIYVTPPDRPRPTLEQANGLAKLLYGGKDVKAWAAAGRSFVGLEVKARELRKCQAPVLFIHGSRESATTKKRVAALHKALKKSTLKVIDGTDHVSTLASPEFGRVIVEFLNANRAK